MLPSTVVYDVLNTLSKYKYGAGKSIAFYRYNDSLNDPRLFKYLKYAKQACPQACIIVGSNGWYLDDNLALELYEEGADYLFISAYTNSESIRFQKMKEFLISKRISKKIAFGIKRVQELDDRLNMVGKGEQPCYAPLTEIVVSSDGKLALCCLDIEQKEAYADVGKNGFEKSLIDNFDYLTKIRNELINGKKNINLCKNCFFCRWESAYKLGKDVRFEQDLLN